jgi:hypothetical protein
LASGNVVLKRRDTGAKEIVPQTALREKIDTTLAVMQNDLFQAAKQRPNRTA